MTHADKALLDKVLGCSNFDAASKLVYQWVKQDHITPAQMGDLMIYAFKKFVY
jgi:hypothetical protein